MELSESILSELTHNPGQTAKQLSVKLGVDKTSINSLLYGVLTGQCYQDKAYRWFLSKGAHKKTEPTQEQFSNTPLARLCRYYLSCLGQDDEGGISVFAANKFGDLDYTEIETLPLEGSGSTFQSAGAQHLFGKMRKDRSRLAMYLGYPTCLKKVQSKKSGWVGCFVEPILLFPVEFDTVTHTPQVSQTFPIINLNVLKRFTNSEREAVMNELVQLEEELGLTSEGAIPEIDELAQRLQSIRDEWLWKESIEPNRLNTSPPLSEISEEGIYNRAVLLIGERSPYTQGLESELKLLAQLNVADYATTALGQWVSGEVDSSLTDTNLPLVEVLPLNLEQRQAVIQSLQNKLTIVTGPPGTGKSQVVSDILINAAWQGKRVLFASKNNKAVDVVETRINNLGPRPILLRVGSNQYQNRLAEYLINLLAATATKDDQATFDESKNCHEVMGKRVIELGKQESLLIDCRNKVDQLEQKIEEARTKLSKEVFDAAKVLNVDHVSSSYRQFSNALTKATKNKQPFFSRLFWGMIKNERHQNLMNATEFLVKAVSTLNVKFVEQRPDDTIIDQWHQFSASILELTVLVSEINTYFSALRELQKTKPLEEISKDRFYLVKDMAENAEKLWQSWLRLQPARLKTSDRQMLNKYNSVLKMVIDTGSEGKLESQVKKQYYRLFPKIAHLLPCWAVTSLSARGKIPFEPSFFDLVVIDEASQCDIASALPLLYRAKRAVIIGDPKQLSHISGLRKGQDQKLLEQHNLVQDYAHWAYSYNSLFDLASGFASGEDIVSLRDHHRSHADIIEFSNRFFYESRLRVATRYDNLKFPINNGHGVRWIHVSGNVVRPANGGAVNLIEAEQVINTIRQLVNDQGYKGTIGVVSPFRAQANLIRETVNRDEAFSAHLIQHEFLSDTVHKFQGDERDVMIFSPVISRGTPAGALGFLRNNGNLFNVAITRARAMLVVVGDQQAAMQCDVSYLAEFSSYVQKIQDAEATKIEQELTDYGPEYPAVDNLEQVSDWEKILYRALYKAGIRTLPQYRLEKYILDMALFEESLLENRRKLDIEVDGETYHRNWTGELCHRDQLRNQRLYELGWDVIRFWVYEIRDDLDGCVYKVKQWLEMKQSA